MLIAAQHSTVYVVLIDTDTLQLVKSIYGFIDFFVAHLLFWFCPAIPLWIFLEKGCFWLCSVWGVS